jgi:TfoX/Sxy family transcriptional regulator of competence genes
MATAMLLHLRSLLEDAAEGLEGVAVKPAFGSFGFFVDHAIFALAWRRDARVGVKFPDEASFEKAMALPGSVPWAPRVPMRSWVLLPESFHDDTDALRAWVRMAHEQVRAMPPKKAREKKPIATRKR